MKSVKMQKIQSLKNKNKIQKQRQRQMEKAKRNTNIIKRQRDVRRQKLKDMKAATMYSAKEEYDNRLRGEFELRSQEERRVCFFLCFLSFFFTGIYYLLTITIHEQLKELERKERELMQRLTRQTSIDIDDGI